MSRQPIGFYTDEEKRVRPITPSSGERKIKLPPPYFVAQREEDILEWKKNLREIKKELKQENLEIMKEYQSILKKYGVEFEIREYDVDGETHFSIEPLDFSSGRPKFVSPDVRVIHGKEDYFYVPTIDTVGTTIYPGEIDRFREEIKFVEKIFSELDMNRINKFISDVDEYSSEVRRYLKEAGKWMAKEYEEMPKEIPFKKTPEYEIVLKRKAYFDEDGSLDRYRVAVEVRTGSNRYEITERSDIRSFLIREGYGITHLKTSEVIRSLNEALREAYEEENRFFYKYHI
ncbi:MAG: hypothetical protein QXP04_00360 [Candidatus Nanoarchaeia archaeon]|nr:hypothetical protein [Candidatus Jingweiarchaeum tengchongense]